MTDVKIPNRVYKYLQHLTEKYPQIKSIWILGSRANNNFTDDSDWDFWVFSNRKIFDLLKENRLLKQESKSKKIDTLVVYNGEDFEEPWPDMKNGKSTAKQGLLSEWKWKKTSNLTADYKGTKEISKKEAGGKRISRVEERHLKAFKIWANVNNQPLWFCSVYKAA